jgi:hypothetical protein
LVTGAVEELERLRHDSSESGMAQPAVSFTPIEVLFRLDDHRTFDSPAFADGRSCGVTRDRVFEIAPLLTQTLND